MTEAARSAHQPWCSHWDHCDCERCIADCDKAMAEAAQRSADASENPEQRDELDVPRLARAIQSTILTSPDQYMGPGMGAYRTVWDDLAPDEQRHVLRDAEALAAEYERSEP